MANSINLRLLSGKFYDSITTGFQWWKRAPSCGEDHMEKVPSRNLYIKYTRANTIFCSN